MNTISLKIENKAKKINHILQSIVLSTILLISLSSFAKNGGGEEEKKNLETASLTVENLKAMLIAEGVQHPEIVLKQAIQETGWFKCTSCSLNRNNIFGFYYKKQYLTYDSWQECVRYYKRWQDRHYKGGDYYTFLQKVGFATDPQYITRLKSIKIKD